MSYDVRQGFRVGPWKVEPLTGTLSGPQGETYHLEPKVMDVFVCLAGRGNELVTRQELLDVVWNKHPDAGDLLTGAVSDLRRALRYGDDDQGFIETVPKRGYRLVGEVRPLIEHTPDRVTTRRNLLVSAAIAGAVFLTALLAPNVFRVDQPASSAYDAAIAVIPLDNFSGDADQAYLADGLTDNLIAMLASVDGLRVISRFSSAAFKDSGITLPALAEKLGVTHVIQGSVLTEGDDIRITAHLIEARSETHLWSDTFQREFDNLFELQDDVSTTIVAALAGSLDIELRVPARGVRPTSSDAEVAIMRARNLWFREGRWPDAMAWLERALEIDPGYAVAHAEMALLYQDEADDTRHITLAERLANAQPHLDRAKELDPDLAETYAAECSIARDTGYYDEAVRLCKKALQQKNPDQTLVLTRVLNWMYDLYLETGQYREAFEMTRRGKDHNPIATPARSGYLHMLIQMNRLDEAERQIEWFADFRNHTYQTLRGKFLSLGGKWGFWSLGYLRGRKNEPMLDDYARRRLSWGFATVGMDDEAIAMQHDPTAEVYRWVGRPGDAVDVARTRYAENPDLVPYRKSLGMALAAAGEYGEARPYLENMWQLAKGRVTLQGNCGIDCAIALIVIRHQAGEPADEILDAINDNVRRYREAGVVRIDLYRYWTNADFEEGLAAFYSGDQARGLDLIERAAKDAVFIPMGEAYLQELYDHPGFAPIRTMQERRQARERERILSEICPNAPYADWEPSPDSCKPFI